MDNQHINFMKEKILVDNFFELDCSEYILEESEETGKSKLKVQCENKNCLCIKNLDKKKTDLLFFKQTCFNDVTEKSYNTYLFKRSDHLIIQCLENNDCNLHIIEMKTGMESTGKLYEVKGKFRATLLFAKGLLAILELNLKHVYMYTT